MTLDQIKYFMALAEYKNYRKAAEKLFISQPTLSRSINELEYSLGIKLLSRDKNGVSLTEAGAVLQELGHHLLNQAFAIETRLKALAGGSSGHLKITSPNINCQPVLSAFNSFTEKYPNISIELEVSEMWSVSEKLNARQTDIGIIFSFATQKEEPALTMLHAADDSFCLLVTEGHPFFDRESVSVEELNSCKMIRYGDSAHKAQMFYDLYRRIGIEEQYSPDSPHIVKSMENALLQLKLFGGTMIVPSVMVQDIPNTIRKKTLIDDFVHYRIIIAWNSINQNPAISLLRRHLEFCGFYEIKSCFT